MFNSAVVPDGDLVILVDDVQMNGQILGHAGSLFLAKFCACLATQYNAQVEELGCEPSEFNVDAYNAALTEALKAYACLNATQYGKLLTMKATLASFTEEGRLSDDQLALIYLRDVALIREIDPSDDGLVDSVLENLPDGDEVQAIITKREEQNAFPATHIFE